MSAQDFRLKAERAVAAPRSGTCNTFPATAGLASPRPCPLPLALLLLPFLLIAAAVKEALARLRP